MTIRFYFDFISPYSYLANERLQSAPYSDLQFEYVPVVLGSIFSKLGVKGPGEIPAKRRYGLQDNLLIAEELGVLFEAPPKHPFNSLYALRTVCAAPPPKRPLLTTALFRATWADGKSLEDPAVLRAVLAECNLSEIDPEEAASDRDLRAMLKKNTSDAIAAGVFGVPTFHLPDDTLIFGQDRLSVLLQLASSNRRIPHADLERLLAR